MKGAVQSFARALWGLRETGSLDPRTALSQGRMLYAAAWRDLEETPGYDPEADLRIDWARQVLAAARAGRKLALADSAAEEAVEMMLREGDWAGFAGD